jgi:hypothetical protein
VLQQEWGPEALALGTRVAYLWCADGILASRPAEAVSRALGDGVTTRNWATVTKLLQEVTFTKEARRTRPLSL